MLKKASVTLTGTVEKIVKSTLPNEPEKAQIAVEAADYKHKVIRINNTLTNVKGQEVPLKRGTKVKITIKPTPELVAF
jgi:hypothetical protein